MAEETGISWCDSTANLWMGCTKLSAACDFCYAEDLMGTEGSRLKQVEWGPHGIRKYVKKGWADLRKWQRAANKNGGIDPKLGRRRCVFINSLSDFFDNHSSIDLTWRSEAWALFRRCPSLNIILVTKRPQNIARMLPEFWDEISERFCIMVTTENQTEFDRRTNAMFDAFKGHNKPGVYAVSAEPLFGPIKFANRARAFLDWVIAGGESGKEARPSQSDWFRVLRDQCRLYRIPFHFKQWGEWLPVDSGHPGLDGPGFGEFDHCLVNEPGNATHVFVGSKKAGCFLDGHQHLEFPWEDQR